MNRAEYSKYSKMSQEGEISDNINPIFILQGCNTELLVKVLNGEINLVELAKRELENRGLDKNGNWVGFKKSIS